MSAHRTAYDLSKSALRVADPAASGTISFADRFGGHCEMISLDTETRKLADPHRAGILATLRLHTDGGTVAVTATNGFNVAANTVATFGDVGDQLFMTSVEKATAGTYRWEILVNTGSVSMS